MNKRDYIKIIEAVESAIEIEKICDLLCGVGTENGVCNGLNGLWEVLRNNAKPEYQEKINTDEDEISFHAFDDILRDETLTAEEKCEKLIMEA